MAGLISQLKSEVLDYLELIRVHLEANLPRKDQAWVAAATKRPDREGLRVGDHRLAVVGSETRGSDLSLAAPTQADRAIPDADPSLTKLRELLKVLNQLFMHEQETVAAVPEQSRLTKEAVRIANELGTLYRFDSIRLPSPDEDGAKRG